MAHPRTAGVTARKRFFLFKQSRPNHFWWWYLLLFTHFIFVFVRIRSWKNIKERMGGFSLLLVKRRGKDSSGGWTKGRVERIRPCLNGSLSVLLLYPISLPPVAIFTHTHTQHNTCVINQTFLFSLHSFSPLSSSLSQFIRRQWRWLRFFPI